MTAETPLGLRILLHQQVKECTPTLVSSHADRDQVIDYLGNKRLELSGHDFFALGEIANRAYGRASCSSYVDFIHDSFRALSVGYQMLESLLLDFCKWQPNKALLHALLDMLVHEKFDSEETAVVKSNSQKRQSILLPINLIPRKWHFLCITHSIGRAFSGGSQLRCYIDGNLLSYEKCRWVDSGSVTLAQVKRVMIHKVSEARSLDRDVVEKACHVA
ncbi:uncharacterized protein LOC141842936 [Curcuma longa]|uniref:uncharacterized protein LOC141842936 n=1 Tax=Curcuma longa TaxID=136217 RepID=UPI003D9ED9FC